MPILSVVVRHAVAFRGEAIAPALSDLVQAILAADLVRWVAERSKLRVAALSAGVVPPSALGVVVEVALLLPLGHLLLADLRMIDLLELGLAEVLHAEDRVGLRAATVVVEPLDRHHGSAASADYTVVVQRRQVDADLRVHLADTYVR